jgi:hypothetical protein
VNSNVRAGSSPALSTKKTLIYKGFFVFSWVVIVNGFNLAADQEVKNSRLKTERVNK